MKQRSLLLVLTGLGLMGLTAAGLGSIKSRQTLGQPGVRLANIPLHDDAGEICARQSVDLPESVAELRSVQAPITRLELKTLPKDTVFGRRIYTNAQGFGVQASVVLMGTDRTSIHKPEICLTAQGWTIERQETAAIHFDRPYEFELPVRKFTASITFKDQAGETRVMKGLYVFWFVADGLVTESHYKRFWWIARDLVFKKILDRWAYISYFAMCAPGNEEETFNRMKPLIVKSVPEFETSFPAPAGTPRTEAPVQ